MNPKKLVTICALVAGLSTGLHAQDVAVNKYTAPDGTVYYYYNKGGEMGYEKDGTLYLAPANKPGVSSGESSLESRMFGVGNFSVNKDTGFAAGYVDHLENLLAQVANQPSMKEGYSGPKDDHYFQDRKWLLDLLYCYSASLTVQSDTGSILNPDTLEAFMNNDFYVNKEVLEKNAQRVFEIYGMISERNFNLGIKEPKGSEKRKEYYAQAIEHGYEIPVKKFGEKKWLSLMGKYQKDYLECIEACYDVLGLKYSDDFSATVTNLRK